MKELRKVHGSELQVLRTVSFNVNAAYAAGGGTLHGR
jgi:hypothetical protein